MNIIYGILCIGIGAYILYNDLKDNKTLNSLKELETDRGISYYAGLFAAIMFVVTGFTLIINFFSSFK
ncbi:MAG: hypothetical protein H0X63_12960 [Flavobacteriales bacterium]|jgi:hypothetical protein|nr:hypothetical protein [Flavobacteriales bacterium]